MRESQSFITKKISWKIQIVFSSYFWSFEDHLDVGALEILADPLIPFLQLLSAEVVLPVANLSFPEEPLHVVVHWIVFAKQWLGAMLAMVSDVEVVIKSQHLEIVTSLF